MIGFGIGKELVPQSFCKEFKSKNAGVCIDNVVGDRGNLIKGDVSPFTKVLKIQSVLVLVNPVAGSRRRTDLLPILASMVLSLVSIVSTWMLV